MILLQLFPCSPSDNFLIVKKQGAEGLHQDSTERNGIALEWLMLASKLNL